MKKILILLLLLISIPLVKAEETEDLAPNAKSAIMIEASTGEILFQKNKDEKLAPASMTKMMSMLLIMEEIENGNLKWNEMITTSEKASSMGGSQIFLKVGEKMTVEDLLKGVAIASGNDAVVALAERVSGSEEQFVKRMNTRAKDLGLKNTNFINATGLTAVIFFLCFLFLLYYYLVLIRYPLLYLVLMLHHYQKSTLYLKILFQQSHNLLHRFFL